MGGARLRLARKLLRAEGSRAVMMEERRLCRKDDSGRCPAPLDLRAWEALPEIPPATIERGRE